MIKGILFDKDGTLLKFDVLWVEATRQVLPRFLQACGVEYNNFLLESLMTVLGIAKNEIAADGALAWMSYWEMAEVLKEALCRKGFSIKKQCNGSLLESLYREEVLAEHARIEPVTELVPLFQWLKSQGIIVGIATADTWEITTHCLKILGIAAYFSYIGTSSETVRPKPCTDLFDTFCAGYDLLHAEVAIVGDTPADMQFARNCGAMAIGVLSGTAKKADLEQKVDFLLKDVSEIQTYWNCMNSFSEKSGRDKEK